MSPTSEGREDAPLIGKTQLLDFCATAGTMRSGHRAMMQLPSRVAVVLSQKEAGAQQGEGLLFHVSLCATLPHAAHLHCETTFSLVRGSGTLCALELWLAKEGVVPGGALGLSLSLLPHMEHRTAGVTNLCRVAGALRTQAPFLKGQGRGDLPMRHRVPR